ncbi:MAG: hypothetical protein ACD_46C00222G0007 [uncultured bacterium]|nr:MAG: hypothetical protein ACD_46C00222G0007 [uncultured bacterium]
MVKLQSHIDTPTDWLAYVATQRKALYLDQIKNAINFYEQYDQASLKKGIHIADILLGLGLDTETLTAALLYPSVLKNEISVDVISEKFGENTAKLLHDVLQMQSLNALQHVNLRNKVQGEQLRKMLLAMASDVQAVLIILAERLYHLREAKNLTIDQQQSLARQTFDLYAPLANRLGIWQLKWEIEDLCLRYLDLDIYTKIAKSLATKRIEREQYIQRVIEELTKILNDAKLKNFQVMGRGKHIYSIYAKMQRKNSDFSDIYDISAFRILVDTIPECYTVLSILQNQWQQIPEEFDDYISQPKPNGYQSLHTVMIGPDNQIIEVQIRTKKMHQESELGVASHWRYKEGVIETSHYEAKIALLRQIMAWQKEITKSDDDTKTDTAIKDLFADRVYVFTPLGDIIDLPQGSTPLDFAYGIHSEIGHRCKGAKVDNKMVPLTYQLQTGNRIEIITAKEPNPSRDWLNPHFGYLKSPRARSRLQHWFRVKDNLTHEHEEEVESRKIKPIPAKEPKHKIIQPNLVIDDLLTTIAKCCKPLPGDRVIGYITQNRGISIHRKDCSNMAHLKENEGERFIEINISNQFTGNYPVDLQVTAFNRAGLLRDITTILAAEDITLNGLNAYVTKNKSETLIHITIVISTIDELNKAISLLHQIPSISDVRRL